MVEGEPAFEVLAPFTVDGGPTVLVDRGYVRPDPGSKAPDMAALPTGTVTIVARLRDSEAVNPGKDPFRQDGWQQVYSINTDQVAAVTGVPLAGSYLQLVDDQPGGLGVIGLPHLDAGPFLSYGIQWIAFGIIAPIGVGYFVLAEVRQRRLEKAASDDVRRGRQGKTADCRGEARRPVRPTALTVTATTTASATTTRDSTTDPRQVVDARRCGRRRARA